MKTRLLLLALGIAALSLVIYGCGIASGTIFMSQEVDGILTAQANAPTLDETFGGAIVDFTDNEDWDRIDIDGVEDACVRVTAHNNLSTPVSGEIWITPGTDTTGINNRADVIAAGGFRVFSGLALTGGQTRVFTCAETLTLLENLDQLGEAVGSGHFAVWAMGNENSYSIRFEGIFLGVHVTGSL